MIILAPILAALAGSTVSKYANSAADSVKAHASDAVLKSMGNVATMARAGALTRAQSLVSYSAPGRVEPICYVDADCANSPVLPALLQTELNVFMGYWLRAFQMENTRIGGVTVGSRLERFSTHRQPDYLGAIGLEDIDNFLPFDNKQNIEPEFKTQAALEAYSHRSAGGPGSSPTAIGNKLVVGEKGYLSDDALTLIGSVRHTDTVGGGRVTKADTFDGEVNMAVGRIFNVEVIEGECRQNVQVVTRMNVMFVPTETMVHIYTSSSQDIGGGSRIKQWWRGRIDFWKDLVLAQDLIEAHAKNLRTDTTGFYAQMLKRRSDNVDAAIVSGIPSAAASATIVIMSKATADELAAKLGNGGINDFKNRQRFFQQGYAMLLAVIDDRRGSVRMFTRDMAEWTDVDARGLENASKGTGPNVGEILSAFRAGSSPLI